jgi:hypothetical protein
MLFTQNSFLPRDYAMPKSTGKLFLLKEPPSGYRYLAGIGGHGGSSENVKALNRILYCCGCWVKDVALRGAGAGLLKDLPKMQRIAEAVMKNTSLPVTLKTRLGWDQESIVIVDVARMLESIGIKALTVHCRLRTQGNKGEADWSWIRKIKDAGVSIQIVLNGNVRTPQDVKFVFGPQSRCCYDRTGL